MVGPGDLTVEQGEDQLKSYEFGNCTMAHKVFPKQPLYWRQSDRASSVRPVGLVYMVRSRNPLKEWILVSMYDYSIPSYLCVTKELQARTLRDVDLWSLEITK